MAIWGGSAVESFAVPMVFAILIAARSSVFIAAPILLFLGDWQTRMSKSYISVAPSSIEACISRCLSRCTLNIGLD